MSSTFKEGDVVVLRSGGPKMTVALVMPPEIKSQDPILCVWLSPNLEVLRDAFPEAVIRHAESSTKNVPPTCASGRHLSDEHKTKISKGVRATHQVREDYLQRLGKVTK